MTLDLNEVSLVGELAPFSIVDGRLITGQNPASSTSAAEELMKLLGERAAHATA